MVDFQIELKKGPITIRLSGTSTPDLIAAIDDALSMIKTIEEKTPTLEASSIPLTEELVKLKGMPKLQNPTSIRDAISQLMASKWGKTPRVLGEIMAAMETNAVFYPKRSVTSELSRMTRSGLLRRLQSPKGYRYVSGIKKKSS